MYNYTSFCLSTNHFIDTWIASNLGPLWMTLWVFMHKSLCRHIFVSMWLFSSITRNEIVWLHNKYVLNFIKNCSCFPEWLYYLHSHQQWINLATSPFLHQHFLLFFFFILVILVNWHILLVSIYTSLMIMSIFSHAYLPLIYIYKHFGLSSSYWLIRVLLYIWM